MTNKQTAYRYRIGAIVHLSDDIGNGPTEAFRILSTTLQYHAGFMDDVTIVKLEPVFGRITSDVFTLTLDELARMEGGTR